MEVDEGFILGIYNYCDRWCEKCRFTSRCRVFADCARNEAKDSPELKALSAAPPHANDVKQTPGWLEDVLAQIDEAKVAPLRDPPPLPAHYQDIINRAQSHFLRVWNWFKANGLDDVRQDDDPFAIIQWFASMNSAKIHRAIDGLAEFDGDREFPPDHEGSAKVALLGIDRSITAWNDAVAIGRVRPEVAADFVAELAWLREQVETHIPRARAFVRPAFDEPDEVRHLEATDWA